MAINIGTNFAYHGKLPNFDRDKFKTKAAMMAFDENNIDEGHLSYCEEDGNIYQYKSANTVDATTGKWRLFKTDADAVLNGTSTNSIQNKAVFEALKLKADTVALAAYQPKYKADYIATRDFDYSELPNGAEVVDLNGYMMSVSVDNTIVRGEYHNGIIDINSSQVELTGVFYNVIVGFNTDFGYCKINNSTFRGCRVSNISIDDYEGDSTFSNCFIISCVIKRIGCVSFSDLQYCTFAASLGDYAKIENSIIDNVIYNRAVIKDGKPTETGFELNIVNPIISGNAPSCEAVNDALQLKADKTQLNNYFTTTTADSTYAKKSDISNVYKFKGTKTNYADLPTTNRVTGDVWNIINADAEHGIKAGDNVAWNGTAWDNLSGTVDLSAYATKEKAFTKDTVSTEPGQFVAGPINTRGNISLRKIDISDIPDLRSKYQKLDGNGYQEKAKVAGLIVKHGNTGDTGSGYLIAEVDQSVGGQMGPDWYYATDGTIQDIKTKIPKVVLDDTVSTTSDNGVKNSVITKYVDGKVTTINDGIADVRTSLESTQTDFVDLRKKVNAIPKTVILTQAAYNALTTKDPNTIYYING